MASFHQIFDSWKCGRPIGDMVNDLLFDGDVLFPSTSGEMSEGAPADALLVSGFKHLYATAITSEDYDANAFKHLFLYTIRALAICASPDGALAGEAQLSLRGYIHKKQHGLLCHFYDEAAPFHPLAIQSSQQSLVLKQHKRLTALQYLNAQISLLDHQYLSIDAFLEHQYAYDITRFACYEWVRLAFSEEDDALGATLIQTLRSADQLYDPRASSDTNLAVYLDYLSFSQEFSRELLFTSLPSSRTLFNDQFSGEAYIRCKAYIQMAVLKLNQVRSAASTEQAQPPTPASDPTTVSSFGDASTATPSEPIGLVDEAVGVGSTGSFTPDYLRGAAGGSPIEEGAIQAGFPRLGERSSSY